MNDKKTKSDELGDLEKSIKTSQKSKSSLYNTSDASLFGFDQSYLSDPSANMSTLKDLIAKDDEREQDGFPRKIQIGTIKPGSGGNKDSVIVVPWVEEYKFYHGSPMAENETAGTGDEKEEEVLGQGRFEPNESDEGEGDEDSTGPGKGESGDHQIENNAYDLGKILTEKFELPNMQEKSKKFRSDKKRFELTDQNKGSGQILNKKATMKRIVATNHALGRLDPQNPDTKNLIVAPSDTVFYVLSEEIVYESKAVVFFIRDYSGSMHGSPTKNVANIHMMLYSWLAYNYERQVIPRFILHDTEAKEVGTFNEYYNSTTSGGTYLKSGLRLVNEIVYKENIAKDYNVYVFHGTDGDDWDTDGVEAIQEIKRILTYTNRVGFTIARNSYRFDDSLTDVENYLRKFIEDNPNDKLKMDAFDARNFDQDDKTEHLKKLLT